MGSRPPAPFIVGVARSGTTLLRMMLDAHPALAIPPETHFFARASEAFASGEDACGSAVRAMTGSSFWPDFGIPAEDFERQVASISPAGLGPLLRAFYETYAARFGKPRWGDKTPPYLQRMTAIQEALPEAHFVHLIRDGRDVALSVIPLWFGPDDVTEAAHQWSGKIDDARRQARELESYLEVRYEDLVVDPRSVLGTICDFLELDWDEAMLEYHRRSAGRLAELNRSLAWHDGRTIPPAERLAIHHLVDRPPKRASVQRWRREMTGADREAFEQIAGVTLNEVGYEAGL